VDGRYAVSLRSHGSKDSLDSGHRKFIATEERAAVRRLSFQKNLPRVEQFARTSGLLDEMGVV
jgi:hypothetical protein